MPGIWDFIEQNYPQFSGEGRKYLKVFVEGRGIFGRKIKTYWSYYSFLQRSELDAALRTLTQFRDADPARQGGQFHYGMLGRLLEWLTAIRSKQNGPVVLLLLKEGKGQKGQPSVTTGSTAPSPPPVFLIAPLGRPSCSQRK